MAKIVTTSINITFSKLVPNYISDCGAIEEELVHALNESLPEVCQSILNDSSIIIEISSDAFDSNP